MYYISSDLPVRGSPDSFRYISHHGILGQKWGIRRFQNKDGTRTELGKNRTISKNAVLYRTSIQPHSYNEVSTHGTTRVFVSDNKEDNKRWAALFKKYDPDHQYYSTKIRVIRDLEVAGETKLGELWTQKMLEDKDFSKQTIRDLIMSNMYYGLQTTDSIVGYKTFAKTLGYHTKSGDDFLKYVHENGYDALEDVYGKTTAKTPLIILDPVNNIKKIKTTKIH